MKFQTSPGRINSDRLTELAPIFTKHTHILGDEFSLLDVAIAPLLWRLQHYGITTKLQRLS